MKKLLFLKMMFLVNILVVGKMMGQGFISAASGSMFNDKCRVLWHIGDMLSSSFSAGQGTTFIERAENDGATADFQFFPNPANSFIKVNNISGQHIKYKIFDLSGKVIASGTADGDGAMISLSGIAPSIYFIQLAGKNEVFKSYKLIKQ